MTLHARVSRLDDYSGELSQALEKLEIERSRGALNRDEQLDFLADLRSAMVERDFLPLKRRGRAALLLGLVIGGGATLVPMGLHNRWLVLVAILAAAALCFAASLWNFARLYQVRRRDEAWLGRLEAAAAKGGTIFEVS